MIARIALGVVAVVASASLVPLFADVSRTEIGDPNDARGLLDVSSVTGGRPMRPRFRVRTYPRWTVKKLRDHGYVLVRLDTIPGRRFDYYVMARSNGKRMLGTLYRDRRVKRDYRMGSVRVTRPDRRGVTVRLRLGRLRWPKSRDHYRWYVQTLFTSDRCRQVCFDQAPDGAPVVQPRPGGTPTPTQTPTITPTTTPTPTPTPTVTPP